nr:MAG TPA: hypothetical protein [Caudoviricetes sp.]
MWICPEQRAGTSRFHQDSRYHRLSDCMIADFVLLLMVVLTTR